MLPVTTSCRGVCSQLDRIHKISSQTSSPSSYLDCTKLGRVACNPDEVPNVTAALWVFQRPAVKLLAVRQGCAPPVLYTTISEPKNPKLGSPGQRIGGVNAGNRSRRSKKEFGVLKQKFDCFISDHRGSKRDRRVNAESRSVTSRKSGLSIQ